METLQNFSLGFASFFTFKLLFVVVAFGLLIFCLLMIRQIQLMNRVLKTDLGQFFSLIGLLFVLGAFCVFVLSLALLFV